MDNLKIGNYIKELRNKNNLTQKELAEKLNISFQAVSKWELGETLPDTAILLDLAELLNTSVDLILNGGTYLNDKRKMLSIKNVVEGFEALENVKNCFGSESLFYKGIVDGINKMMNMDFEDALKNYKDVLYTEVILQAVDNENKIYDISEVELYIKNPKMINILRNKLKQIM